MPLNIVKTPVKQTNSLSADLEKLVAHRISPLAHIFEEHGTHFVGVDQQPGSLILGWGTNIEEAVQAALLRHEG